MPEFIPHYALTKASKNDDKENNKSILMLLLFKLKLHEPIERKSRNENCDRNATLDAT